MERSLRLDLAQIALGLTQRGGQLKLRQACGFPHRAEFPAQKDPFR